MARHWFPKAVLCLLVFGFALTAEPKTPLEVKVYALVEIIRDSGVFSERQQAKDDLRALGPDVLPPFEKWLTEHPKPIREVLQTYLNLKEQFFNPNAIPSETILEILHSRIVASEAYASLRIAALRTIELLLREEGIEALVTELERIEDQRRVAEIEMIEWQKQRPRDELPCAVGGKLAGLPDHTDYWKLQDRYWKLTEQLHGPLTSSLNTSLARARRDLVLPYSSRRRELLDLDIAPRLHSANPVEIAFTFAEYGPSSFWYLRIPFSSLVPPKSPNQLGVEVENLSPEGTPVTEYKFDFHIVPAILCKVRRVESPCQLAFTLFEFKSPKQLDTSHYVRPTFISRGVFDRALFPRFYEVAREANPDYYTNHDVTWPVH